MSDKCAFPMCTRHPQSNGYCISHRIYASGPVVKKPTPPIPKRSSKMKDVMKELAKLYGIFLAKPGNEYCKLRLDDRCNNLSQTVHHVRGRIGEQVFVQKDWLPSCSYCNTKLEAMDGEARKKGLKKSKFSPKDKKRYPKKS